MCVFSPLHSNQTQKTEKKNNTIIKSEIRFSIGAHSEPMLTQFNCIRNVFPYHNAQPHVHTTHSQTRLPIISHLTLSTLSTSSSPPCNLCAFFSHLMILFGARVVTRICAKSSGFFSIIILTSPRYIEFFFRTTACCSCYHCRQSTKFVLNISQMLIHTTYLSYINRWCIRHLIIGTQ